MKKISYFDETRALEGTLFESGTTKKPTVILCHAWSGKDSYIEEKAELIASWGYTTFALDMYGKGILVVRFSYNRQCSLRL